MQGFALHWTAFLNIPSFTAEVSLTVCTNVTPIENPLVKRDNGGNVYY